MSYISIHAHIVFATKNRHPMIQPTWRERLYEYLGGTVNGLDAFSQGIGGVEDHVQNQEDHHRHKTHEEELVELLESRALNSIPGT